MSFVRDEGILKLSDEKFKRFEHVYYDIKTLLEHINVDVTVGVAFNSGYEGFLFEANGIRVYVIEQDGKVGAEAQVTAYISLRVNGLCDKVVIRHRDKYFGDVVLSKEELSIGYELVKEELKSIFKSI